MKKRSFNVISARRPEQISMRPSARRFPSFITSTQWNTFSSARNIVIIWLKYPQPKAPRPLIRANYSTVLNCWFQDSRTKESKSRSREQRADKASSLSLELLAHDRRTFLGPNLSPPTDRTNERTTKGRASNQVPFFFFVSPISRESLFLCRVDSYPISPTTHQAMQTENGITPKSDFWPTNLFFSSSLSMRFWTIDQSRWREIIELW